MLRVAAPNILFALFVASSCATAQRRSDAKWVCDQGDPLAGRPGQIVFEDVQRALCYLGTYSALNVDEMRLAHDGAFRALSRCEGGERSRRAAGRRVSSTRDLHAAFKAAIADVSRGTPGCSERAILEGMIAALGEDYSLTTMDQQASRDDRQTATNDPFTGIINGRVLYGRFPFFVDGTHATFGTLLSEPVQGRVITGVVLDLRRSSGGRMDELVRFLDLFIDDGPLIEERTRRGEVKRHGATRRPAATSLPVIALTDAETVSGSEAVAAALRATGRGVLFGTRTRGRAPVQTTVLLPSRSVLSLPVADLWVPGGERITGRGVQPDIELAVPTPALDVGKNDSSIAFAVRVLNESPSGSRDALLETARRLAGK